MALPDPEYQPEFYDYAPAKRALALAIDLIVGIVLGSIAFIFVGLTVELTMTTDRDAFQRLLPFIIILIFIAYRTAMLARYGATIGMFVTVHKWRSLDGSKPDLKTAFLYSAMHATIWLLFPLQLISIVMLIATPYRQGLHDRVLGTTMLHSEASE